VIDLRFRLLKIINLNQSDSYTLTPTDTNKPKDLAALPAECDRAIARLGAGNGSPLTSPRNLENISAADVADVELAARVLA
jgi:hypothetical protein